MKECKTIILKDDRFQKVKSGEMSVWLTLNDDFAKSIQIGDLIAIMNDKTSKFIYARCNGFYAYGSFEELYNKVDKTTLGHGKHPKVETVKDYMYMQCSPEAEKQFGVRGIKFEYLPDYKDPNDMTNEEAQAYLQGMVKGVQKARRQLFRSLEKTDGMTRGLARFVADAPEMYFASMDGEIENDELKWLLSEHIKHTQTLLDSIQEYEDKCKFPVIHKYSNHRNTPTKKTK